MKTIFFLGAGFSREADFPLQKDLLLEIFEINPNLLNNKLEHSFIESKRIVKAFLNHIGFRRNFLKSIELEDLFSYLDKAIDTNSYFRKYNEWKIKEVRTALIELIVIFFHFKSQNSNQIARQYISDFASALVNTTSYFSINKYPFSIITTNWDNLLESELYFASLKANKQILIDYNLPNSLGFRRSNKLVHKFSARAKGIPNINVLKLHGSVSWLLCPRCQRMYVDHIDSITIRNIFASTFCRKCENNFGEADLLSARTFLEFKLLMPTFLKQIGDINLKMVWNKSAHELREADRIVFIGYSLPLADFEIKNLIFSNIKARAEIHVVLGPNDDPKNYEGNDLFQLLPALRFKKFLGNSRKYKFYFEGAASYINAFSKDGVDEIRVRRIKFKQERYELDEDSF